MCCPSPRPLFHEAGCARGARPCCRPPTGLALIKSGKQIKRERQTERKPTQRRLTLLLYLLLCGWLRTAATNFSASSQAAWRAVLSNTHQISLAFVALTVAAN